MNHACSIPLRRRRAGGAGIVTAIFLLVVLAGLGVAMVTIFGSQRQGLLLDEQGARAYQAARAGIEWGLYQRRVGSTTDCNGTPVSFGFPKTTTLAGFAVTVECTRTAGPASSNPAVNLDRWHIRATACSTATVQACANAPKGPDYVQRVLEVQI